jgi:hypothetical protein
VVSSDQDFATMQDFIVGRLSDDERRAFEDRLVDDPALARELEQSLRMREGLQQLRTQGYFQKPAPRFGGFRVWVPSLVAAAGAGLALFLWLSRVTGPSPILMAARDGTPSVAAHFTFVAVRGGSAPDLELPSAGLIEIRAAPSTSETFHGYRVSLVRQIEGASAQSVATLAGLAVGRDGYVHFYADASRLALGDYLLRIQPDTDAPDEADVFRFNLRSRGTGASR